MCSNRDRANDRLYNRLSKIPGNRAAAEAEATWATEIGSGASISCLRRAIVEGCHAVDPRFRLFCRGVQYDRAMSDRLDEIACEIRSVWARVETDIATTRDRLIEARNICRRRGISFDTWITTGRLGISKPRVYQILGPDAIVATRKLQGQAGERLALDVSQNRPVRKSPAGIASNDLIVSASTEGNAAVFADILNLYVEPGQIIADVTYGRGTFWADVPEGLYEVCASDIKTGTDCRALPFEAGSIDCVVFDPPYMHSPGGTAHTDHQNFEDYYGNNEPPQSELKYHDAVLDLYFRAADEARRVLRKGGIYIVKCQDEVCSNRQRLTHVEIINELDRKGFQVEDLFVVVRLARPGVSRMVHQVHARKNHSYFIVFSTCR